MRTRLFTFSVLLVVVFIAGLLSTVGCRSGSHCVTLVHTNDMHGIYQPYKMRTGDGIRLVGGMESLSHHINLLRAQDPELLLIDCGDIMTGTIATQIEYRGAIGGIMVEFMNRLGYDVWGYGNHAFDRGPENLRKLTALARFPAIMANVVDKKTGKRFAKEPYHIFKRNGLRIGVVAVMEENFLIEVHKPSVADLDILPIVPTLKTAVAFLDPRTDLIIVLLHAKFPVGEKAAREVSGIDVILTASEEGRFEDIEGILVKSTFGHQRTLGYLRLEVKDDRVIDHQSDLIWLWADSELRPSESVSGLLHELEASISSEFNRVIGEALRDLGQEGAPVECALGNWITDVMRWKTGAQIAFHNSGGIRADILTGPLTKGDIYKVYPFDNTLVLFDLTGMEVRRAIEQDIERGWDRMQVSGLRYTYVPKSEKPQGQRVRSLMIGDDVVVKDGEVIHPDAVYSVVSNSYVTGHTADKYFGFSIDETSDTEWPLQQVLLDWMETFGILDYQCDNRIFEIGSAKR